MKINPNAAFLYMLYVKFGILSEYYKCYTNFSHIFFVSVQKRY